MTGLLALLIVLNTGASAEEHRSTAVRHLPPRTHHGSTAVRATQVQPAGVRPAGGGAPRGAGAQRGIIHGAASGAVTTGAGARAAGSGVASRSRVGWFDQRVASAQSWFARTIKRRDDSGGGGTPAPPADPGPPIVAGQLIRTEGLGAIVSQPSEPARLYAVEAGDRIGIDESKVTPRMSGRGTFIGPRDTPPPPNPGAGGGGASGANAITERTDTTNVSATATSDSSSSGGWIPPGQQKKQQ